MRIKEEQYRPCVAMLLMKKGRVLLFERSFPSDGWQVPQGGIDKGEDKEEAMWRELKEETGITSARIVGHTQDYLYYTIPRKYRTAKQKYLGQKQLWFLLRITGEDNSIQLNNTTNPEFKNWNWVSYWHSLAVVVSFKQEVYRQALVELLPAALKLGV